MASFLQRYFNITLLTANSDYLAGDDVTDVDLLDNVAKLGAQTIPSVQSFGNLKRMIDEYLALYRQLARRRES